MPAWVHFTTGFYFYHNKLNNKVKVKYIIVTMHSCDSCRWHSHCFSWGYGRLLSLLIGLPADLSSKQKMAETCRSHGYFTLCLTQQKVFLFAVDVGQWVYIVINNFLYRVCAGTGWATSTSAVSCSAAQKRSPPSVSWMTSVCWGNLMVKLSPKIFSFPQTSNGLRGEFIMVMTWQGLLRYILKATCLLHGNPVHMRQQWCSMFTSTTNCT